LQVHFMLRFTLMCDKFCFHFLCNLQLFGNSVPKIFSHTFVGIRSGISFHVHWKQNLWSYHIYHAWYISWPSLPCWNDHLFIPGKNTRSLNTHELCTFSLCNNNKISIHVIMLCKFIKLLDNCANVLTIIYLQLR
jgi:hypothetical protein